ncbi:MAG: hypothetical protein RIQ60_2371 [Pseudomonadota bacterium]|jgi:uncharacterized protein (TIGR04255 family)
MTETPLVLKSAPIVEAVVDIECDMPNNVDIDALDAAAAAAFADRYPSARRRMLSEHQISAAPDGPVAVTSRQGLQALQYFSVDEKQLIQFRPTGFSFNRLAPYSTLDDYLAEIERTLKIFIDITKPVVCRMVRLRYINRIQLPMTAGGVDIDDYLKLAPRLADEERLSFVGFFNQHSVQESATGNQANIVFATQPPTGEQLPIIFDIEAFSTISCDPSNWSTISATIQSLRSLKNLVFRNSLTEKCLNLFQP